LREKRPITGKHLAGMTNWCRSFCLFSFSFSPVFSFSLSSFKTVWMKELKYKTTSAVKFFEFQGLFKEKVISLWLIFSKFAYRDSVPRFSTSGFFPESVSPQPRVSRKDQLKFFPKFAKMFTV
jgi:hypothetical protein